jgi:hypothetical protein
MLKPVLIIGAVFVAVIAGSVICIKWYAGRVRDYHQVRFAQIQQGKMVRALAMSINAATT